MRVSDDELEVPLRPIANFRETASPPHRLTGYCTGTLQQADWFIMHSLNVPRALCLWLMISLCCQANPSNAPGEHSASDPVAWLVGAAKVDVTPAYPIRLSGYGNRKTESGGVAQKLWAKAIAIRGQNQAPAVLVSVDNCGLPSDLTEAVAGRLNQSHGVPRERFVLCSTHTHSAPCVTGVLPNLFSQEISHEQQAVIDQYTRELTANIEAVAKQALENLTPGRIDWTETEADFARNRRTPGGPVDPALPVLRISDTDGQVLAVVANYACHATTLQGEFNELHGDWPGSAQQQIERDFPGAVALTLIGCGADANPHPRGQIKHAEQHGATIAQQTQKALAGPLRPLNLPLVARFKKFELPFDELPTREEWERRSTQPGIVGHHARVNLARLDRGETLPQSLPYSVQVWHFGDQLAMVFLPGEVVVDYVLRLKKEYDATRLWVTAYANDVPCYIPSRRILKEGGYEAESSLWYYDRPARLAPETEDRIHNALSTLIPVEFVVDPGQAEFPPPKSPEAALESIFTRPGLKIELVASEPHVVDPVAIDWGPDGRLWVVEMRDFPSGINGTSQPGGRVKVLYDSDGDGTYDQSKLFLDGIPFPTGITAWNRGVLVCAAPDILYAEDTDGDGHADLAEPVFTGFATENYQARVNSLTLGLDNWIYGANGLIGGIIQNTGKLPTILARRDLPLSGEADPLDIRGRDFRFNPFHGAFEAAAGLTQQGRVRDDWDNWFGCDNSTLLWHFPLPAQYARRNDRIGGALLRLAVSRSNNLNELFPLSRTLRRFNDPHHVNRVTSACGLGLYRDQLLGDEYYGNAFVCEPVHNVVRRLVLTPRDLTFEAKRASGEAAVEFIASTDNWFRPVQVRTGPDGALWIVDMYRFVVEHPRWITPERLKTLDLRAGDDRGRLYRVYPNGAKLRAVPNLKQLATPALAAALDTPNGTERDRIHLELLHRNDSTALPALHAIARTSANPASRVQALAVSQALKPSDPSLIRALLDDLSPDVRAMAIRFAETHPEEDELVQAALEHVTAPELRIRYQVALSSGSWRQPAAARALARLALNDHAHPLMRAAILSSAPAHGTDVAQQILRNGDGPKLPAEFAADLIATAARLESREGLQNLTLQLAASSKEASPVWTFHVVAALLKECADKQLFLNGPATESTFRNAAAFLSDTIAQARAMLPNPHPSNAFSTEAQLAAIQLLGQVVDRDPANAAALVVSVRAGNSQAIQRAALDALQRSRSTELAKALLQDWQRYSPTIRNTLLDLLLRRAEWSDALLHALEQGKLVTDEIPISIRQRLSDSANETMKQRARTLFSTGASGDREALIQTYQQRTAAAGDRNRGAQLFSLHCAMCHQFDGIGTRVGPDLHALTDKSPTFLLRAILDPNAAVETRYANYQIQTQDGRLLSGIIANESDTDLTLLNSGGTQEKIARRDVVTIQASPLSLMPEGFEAALTPEQMADLIAFLRTTADIR